MQRLAQPRSRRPLNRSGLAPVELVLVTPLLLMVMALMVVYGQSAYFKIRGATIAREAAFSSRWPRTGQQDLPPRSWPQPGQRNVGEDQAYDRLELPALRHPVVRGPLDNGVLVDAQLFDNSRGALRGSSEITHQRAMLPKLGEFHYQLQLSLLDGKFQYPQMGIPRNVFRRIPTIYTLPRTDANLSQAFQQAASQLLSAPFRPDLRPLDRDEEIYAFYGHYVDFHPRVAGFCDTDAKQVRQNEVSDLIDRIQGSEDRGVPSVPEVMTQFWIQMRRAQMQALQSSQHSPRGTVPWAAWVAQMGAAPLRQSSLASNLVLVDRLLPPLAVALVSAAEGAGGEKPANEKPAGDKPAGEKPADKPGEKPADKEKDKVPPPANKNPDRPIINPPFGLLPGGDGLFGQPGQQPFGAGDGGAGGGNNAGQPGGGEGRKPGGEQGGKPADEPGGKPGGEKGGKPNADKAGPRGGEKQGGQGGELAGQRGANGGGNLGQLQGDLQILEAFKQRARAMRADDTPGSIKREVGDDDDDDDDDGKKGKDDDDDDDEDDEDDDGMESDDDSDDDGRAEQDGDCQADTGSQTVQDSVIREILSRREGSSPLVQP